MAFGKDNSHLKNIPSFGGSVAQKAANATRSRKAAPRTGGGSGYGGGRPHWVDNFRPSELKPDVIRLIPGAYQTQRVEDGVLVEETTPWVEFTEHYHAKVKCTTVCSAGPWRRSKKDRSPCYGCDIYWNGYDRAQGGNTGPVNMIGKYAFCVLDTGLFHKLAQTDDNGNVKKNQKGEPYYDWHKCIGMGCQGCHTAIESKQGHVQPWAMSRTQFIQLNGYSESIGNCCTNCDGRDTISTVMWQCANPECGDLILDVATTTLTQEQVNNIVNQPYKCRACQTVNYPEEVVQCSGCENAQRASIYDVTLQVKSQRTTDKGSTIQVLSYNVGPIEAKFAELLTKLPELDKRFSAYSLEQQSKLFRYTPPADAEQHYVPKP